MKNKKLYGVVAIVIILAAFMPPVSQLLPESEYQMTPGESLHVHSHSGLGVTAQSSQDVIIQSDELPTDTPTSTATDTPTSTATDAPTATATASRTSTPSATNTAPPQTASPAPTSQGNIAPFRSAPGCVDGNGDGHADVTDAKDDEGTSLFGAIPDYELPHDIWNEVDGCHYDHEHGANPFTAEVAATFPGFDLLELQCRKGVSHCNPSSPMENTHKHGGHKIDLNLNAPHGCAAGFEGGTITVDAYVIQYHAFGDQEIEFESRTHSATALLRQCKPANPNDKGYMFVGTLQQYGEGCTPYQGRVIRYPNNFSPEYDCAFGQYMTTDNTFNRDPNSNNNNNSKWTSKQTGCRAPCIGTRPPANGFFRLLFDLRDGYKLFNINDLTYPFSWVWMCGGANYNPAGCRFNNSTTTVHEIAGDIPIALDGLRRSDGTLWDTDTRVGRVTGEFYLDSLGVLKLDCDQAGNGCYPLKLVSAFVGRYTADLCVSKCSNNTPENTKERDVYFCSGLPCAEGDAGAVPSGWISESN